MVAPRRKLSIGMVRCFVSRVNDRGLSVRLAIIGQQMLSIPTTGSISMYLGCCIVKSKGTNVYVNTPHFVVSKLKSLSLSLFLIQESSRGDSLSHSALYSSAAFTADSTHGHQQMATTSTMATLPSAAPATGLVIPSSSSMNTSSERPHSNVVVFTVSSASGSASSSNLPASRSVSFQVEEDEVAPSRRAEPRHFEGIQE